MTKLVDRWAKHRRQAWIMAGLYFVTGFLFWAFGRDEMFGWSYLAFGVVYVGIGLAVERRSRHANPLAPAPPPASKAL